MPELPLAGIRVLDATAYIAGPFGATVLADLGAEVIKVETPSGDPARSMAPLDGDRSAYFHVVNRNKSAITLDLKSPHGRNELESLLDGVDVFLNNFLPQQLKSMELLPGQLMLKRPRLIIGNLSSYGSDGPSATWPGYDATVQARVGIMHVTGEASGPPVRAGVSILDIGTGTWLALGILAAIVKRERTGLGSLVETSLFESGALWVSYHLAAHEITHNPSVRSGSGHPAFSPYGIFLTQKGTICIGVGNNAIFTKLCELLGRKDLITDPRFINNVDRVAHATELKTEIENALAGKSADEWASDLANGGVPADRVQLPEYLFDDAQALAMKIMVDYPDSMTPINALPGLPLRFDGVRPPIRTPAPHFDAGPEHKN